VERRGRLGEGAALDGAGKRAGFALYYGALHLLTVREVAKAVGAARLPRPQLVDLGCGTLAAGAGWALAVREAGQPVELLGVEKNGWAAGEARFTLAALGLSGKVVRDDVVRFEIPSRAGAVLAAFTANELDDSGRQRLLAALLAAAARGAHVLVVEPLAERGGRADEWRFEVPQPARLRLLDKAAGLDHRRLQARSLYLAGAS
jgi:hypothetical protein